MFPRIDLFSASCPQLSVPSPTTVAQDITSAFTKCQSRIAKLLQDHPGRLHFTTEPWTSPNYRAFVTWTVHLQHKGVMLTFLLDIIEVPGVCRLLMSFDSH